MDPLSEILSLLKPRSHSSSGFDAGGEWAVQFGSQHLLIKCYAVVSGACWLIVEGLPEAVWLVAGECFVLPSGRPFRLASNPAAIPIDAATVFSPARAGGVVTLNGGGDFFLVGSRFAVSGQHAAMLMDLLPPIVHIRQKTEQAALRWSIERMMQELREQQPGGHLIAQHLAHMMLIQALRLHLADPTQPGTGWIFALGDKHLGPAIRALHANPAQRWTLQEFARHACLSRSSFAERFKRIVGNTPMEYVTRWRMLLACERIENGQEAIARIAPELGYESDSAFSTAFKRVIGYSPREFSRMLREKGNNP